jgi:hypothetical protein
MADALLREAKSLIQGSPAMPGDVKSKQPEVDFGRTDRIVKKIT